MYRLDLSFGNRSLYRGCGVTEFERGKYRMDTPLDSVAVILAANLREIVKYVPEIERDELVLTGSVPPVIYMTAQSVLQPFFRKISHYDGNRGTNIGIPGPGK